MTDDMLAVGRDVDDFMDALRLLDERLGETGAGPMRLRAVGGFALMCHGLRQGRSTTLDIDTVTPTPTAEQSRVIESVARDLGFPRDWINDDTVLSMGDVTTQEDCDVMDAMIDARYLPASDVIDGFPDLENIDLEIADLPTLAHSKAYAVLSVGRGRTSKDALDFMDVARALDAPTLSRMHEALPWLDDPTFGEFDDIMRMTVADIDDREPVSNGPSREKSEDEALGGDPNVLEDVDGLKNLDDFDGLDDIDPYAAYDDTNDGWDAGYPC